MSINTTVRRRGVYFITFTCYKWLPLIELTKSYDSVYKFFDVMKKAGNRLLGFVIMPNHVHLLLDYANATQSLNVIIGNGKRFIGYNIVRRLEQQGENFLLSQLKDAVNATDRQRNKKHELWQPSFDVKECRTEKFLLQKLNYIHNNPCSGKWQLCKHPYKYAHSSSNYYDGDKSGYAVKDYLDVLVELRYCDEYGEDDCTKLI